ncbi:MAG: tRNA (adenosine(37)-N6)-threonylcarbamoyltransferase complex dimerization subunit type 1 TsaB, partial [Rhodospirillaceae bacterium]|nr:tRNA (adenosine(37)-N6)-threonylcarbamoyltransferase complex dimerization subunit type 1 TsaB [Rhodospirillaceae bacterium]
MKILVFDTALGACTVGVVRDGTVLAAESAVMAQGHAEALMPMIARVMAKANTTYTNLDRIAVTVGPGSFTGLRVGISTARGLAMAAGKPAVGLTTTEVLAAHVANAGTRIMAVIDSKRGDVFAQLFAPNGTEASPIVNLPDDALAAWCGPGPVLLVGDAADRAAKVIGHAQLSNASSICTVEAMAVLAATRAPIPQGPVPVYARA